MEGWQARGGKPSAFAHALPVTIAHALPVVNYKPAFNWNWCTRINRCMRTKLLESNSDRAKN